MLARVHDPNTGKYPWGFLGWRSLTSVNVINLQNDRSIAFTPPPPLLYVHDMVPVLSPAIIRVIERLLTLFLEV